MAGLDRSPWRPVIVGVPPRVRGLPPTPCPDPLPPAIPVAERDRRGLSATTKAAVAALYGLRPEEDWAPVQCYWCHGVTGWASWSMWEGQRVGNVSLWDMQWDHVTPISRGGKNVPENIVIACNHCNLSKGNRALPSSLKEACDAAHS